MTNVGIVTDSACDLTDEEVTSLGIEVVPLSIRFGDEEFEDRTELTSEGFYDKMATADVFPETAAPSPGKFAQAFQNLAAGGATEIVCINLSSKLSATMQSAENAARDMDGDVQVHVVDSRSITSGLGMQVIRAGELAGGGASAAEIVALVTDLSTRTKVYGALNSLDNLKKGGRIGGAQALLGGLLSIKPVINISSGEVQEAGKPRTRKKALEMLRDKVFESPDAQDLCVYDGFADDRDSMIDLLAERYDPATIRTGHIGAVIGTHGGPGVIGVTWFDPAS
ncbi:MAG TPA: DegV family protein [Acidimicrobiales bacterium]|nr:DegV family protein [Acidimicrobiales bacterium]